MKIRKNLRFSTIFVMIILFIVSVGSSAAQDKESVTIWFPISSGGDEETCLRENSVDAFNETSETYEIEWVSQPPDDNYRNLIRTAVAAGSGPDVILTDGAAFTFELASAGLMLPLDDYIADYGWDELIAQWALGLVEIDGMKYGIPEELESVILYYNETVFEEHGWEAPATIDEMIALAETIDEAGLIPFATAFGECAPCIEWQIGQYLNHWAGPDKVRQALLGEIQFTDPDFVEAIEILGEQPGKGWFMGSLDNYFSLGFQDYLAALGNGEAVMNIEGTWRINDLTDNWFGEAGGNENEWNWVPMPTKSGAELWDIGAGGMWSINAASEVPDGAAEFMNFWFSADNQVNLLQTCGFQLAPIAVPEGSFDALEARAADIFTSLLAASDSNNIGYTPWTFFPSKTDVYLYTEIQRVFDGQITAEEYLQGMQVVFDEELAAGEVPPIPITNGTN